MIPLARSAVFNALLYATFIVVTLAALLIYPAPRIWHMRIVQAWARFALQLLAAIAGTRVEIRGAERVPSGPLIVASKHQSLIETVALVSSLDDPAFILKRELMWIPIFGWWMVRLGMIPVRRGARSAAISALADRARVEVARGRQIVIFPEGTRRTPGDVPAYKFGVTRLYCEVGAVCMPVALNTGLFWPRRTFLRHPGTMIVQFLPPIPPGLDRDDFARALQERIETASDRLLLEAARSPDPPPLPPAARARLQALAGSGREDLPASARPAA